MVSGCRRRSAILPVATASARANRGNSAPNCAPPGPGCPGNTFRLPHRPRSTHCRHPTHRWPAPPTPTSRAPHLTAARCSEHRPRLDDHYIDRIKSGFVRRKPAAACSDWSDSTTARRTPLLGMRFWHNTFNGACSRITCAWCADPERRHPGPPRPAVNRPRPRSVNDTAPPTNPHAAFLSMQCLGHHPLHRLPV